MPGKLIFDARQVAKSVAEAKMVYSPEQRRPTLQQFIDGGAYGKDLKLNATIAHVVKASTGPELHLVKDDGVYLMANVWFPGTNH
jgi:hypothetical protein